MGLPCGFIASGAAGSFSGQEQLFRFHGDCQQKIRLGINEPRHGRRMHLPRHENFKPPHECPGVQLRTREIAEQHPGMKEREVDS
jgi:hypothetical protein